MKDQILDVISLIQFQGISLIPIKKEIRKLFENKEIKFQISIKDNKIIIESPEISQDLEIQDNVAQTEAIIVK